LLSNPFHAAAGTALLIRVRRLHLGLVAEGEEAVGGGEGFVEK